MAVYRPNDALCFPTILFKGCMHISIEGLPEIQWALFGLAFK